MATNMRGIRLLLILWLFLPAKSPAANVTSLDGPGWTFRTTLEDKATEVTVPHCWPASEAYRRYLGIGTYERDFDYPAPPQGKVVRLHFDAVYETATVWLNGHRLGTHHGGYTPFAFEVTDLLKPGKNHLLVEVDNTPTLSSIPAIATAAHGGLDKQAYGVASVGEGIVGWMPYGGIVRPVTLLMTDEVYLQTTKFDAVPDLARHVARVTVHMSLHNGSNHAARTVVYGTAAGLNFRFSKIQVGAHGETQLSWSGMLNDPHLWSVRDPFLYDAHIELPGDELTTRIGVRAIRVQGTELLLNGQPVHLFGGNRVSEDPQEGLRESDATLQRDMSDMLAANMRMMRIAHYPQAPALLDFADQHGMLLIAEVGNWNMSAWQMADPEIRSKWRQEMKEMMEQDWNHPSVIAWSMGNEYESATKEGITWTRDMRHFTLALDATRLITFASRFVSDPALQSGQEEASRYSDFICVNFYGNFAESLDHIHQLYPRKPIFVSEFGSMGEPGKHDPERIKSITGGVEAIKARPWVIGGSIWTWADYRSLHRGTESDGIRHWGIVNLERDHRDSWQAVQKLFAVDLP